MLPRCLSTIAALVTVASTVTAAAESTDPDRPADTVESAPASVSCGHANRGGIANAVQLEPEGDGYLVPAPWQSRGFQYGTRELIDLIQRIGARMAADHPDSVLGVADLSAQRGGAVRFHRSHQSGRDVDLLYYAKNAAGEPIDPDGVMPYYEENGVATHARSPIDAAIDERTFDVERNWAVIKMLLTDPQTRVVNIFVSGRVKRWLLAHAEAVGEPEEILADARTRLRRARRGHHDHMHLRIECTERDRALGDCQDGSARPPRRGRKWGGLACTAPETPSITALHRAN